MNCGGLNHRNSFCPILRHCPGPFTSWSRSLSRGLQQTLSHVNTLNAFSMFSSSAFRLKLIYLALTDLHQVAWGVKSRANPIPPIMMISRCCHLREIHVCCTEFSYSSVYLGNMSIVLWNPEDQSLE